MMRLYPALLILLLLQGCGLKTAERRQQAAIHTFSGDAASVDTVFSAATEAPDPYDSLARAIIDTTTLVGKRQWIMNQFLAAHRPAAADFDTLLDLTYDGADDYVVGYYGMSGTGIKNRVEVYLYHLQSKCYIRDKQLSQLPNPTFYIRKRKITGFYLGNGGGSGSMLEWRKGRWIVVKEFEVRNEGDTTKWHISYPVQHKTRVKIMPYQMLPPREVLATDIDPGL